MGNRWFLEFFAKIELDAAAGIVPENFTLYSSVHAAPLPFDPVSRAWTFDYCSVPNGEEVIRINVSTSEDDWPRSEVAPSVFATVKLRISTFAVRFDGVQRAVRDTFVGVDVVPWFLRDIVKGSYFIRWDAAKFWNASQLGDLLGCVEEQSVDRYYQHLLPADIPKDQAVPARFLFSSTKLTDFFGARSNGTTFQDKSLRYRHFDSLTAWAGKGLGLNCASLDRWTWEGPGLDPPQSGSLDSAAVNDVADRNLIPFRTQICPEPLQRYGSFARDTIGMGIHSGAIVALWNQAHALPGASDTPIEAQREIMGFDIHAGGNPSDEFSRPWSRLRLLVIGEETNFNVNAALHLFLNANQIAALTPGSIAYAWRETLDKPETLKQPLRPGWNRGQDIALEYHAEFIAYLQCISPEPGDWGVDDFGALGPLFVEHIDWLDPVTPWERLARDGDPCALTLERGPCAIKRKLYLHSILFVHDQVAKSSGLLARRATEAVRILAPGTAPRFYIGFGTNSFYCRAFMGDGNVYRDAFAEARQNAALVADGMNPITPWMEDNDMNGYALPDMIGHAEFLRSVAMMSLPSGNQWPEQPGPGAIGEHSLYLNVVNYRSDETDDLLYRGLVQVGSGAKSMDFFGGFGPDIRVVAADGEDTKAELNVWAPGPRPRQVRALTEMLRRAEDVLYPARPQRSPIAILITRCSEVWDTNKPGSPLAEYPAYAIERIQLATPLAHAGHPLDYLDEIDLLQGALTARNYLVLYLVDPNLPAAAVPIVCDWVAAGGTLTVLPGAAVEDEYGYPAGPELDALLGVARRGHLYARPPHEDLRGLKLKDPPWNKNTDAPLGIRVAAPSLSFPGASGVYPVEVAYWAQSDGTPLWTFHPLPDSGVETLATWVALGAGSEVISELTFGEQPTPLPVLTRREHGQGAAFCYGILPGALYKGAAAYIDGPSRSFAWRPDLRLFAIAPMLLTPRGALSPVATARIVRGGPGRRRILDTHGAASVRHLQSDRGIALVVANWARDPSLSPSRSFRVLVSYLLPQHGLEPFNAKTASGTPITFRIEGRQIIFEMQLFSADIITFELRSASSHPFDDAIPSYPRMGYVVCDIGKDILSAVSTNNDPIIRFGASVHDVEAHMRFLSS